MSRPEPSPKAARGITRKVTTGPDRSRISAVIFDLFHTLTGPESTWSDLPVTSAVLGIDRVLWDDLLVSRSRWRLAGEVSDPHEIISTLARQADPTISEDRIREAVRVRVQRFRDTLLRIPIENLETLRTLRSSGFKLGLISNADVTEVAAWNDSALAGLFDAEVFSCHVGCVKPERDIYEKCLAALRLPPQQCLFVGDGGSNELVAAKDIGMSTVFISGIIAELWPERVGPRLGLCDHHIESIPQLLGLLGIGDLAMATGEPIE